MSHNPNISLELGYMYAFDRAPATFLNVAFDAA
jgi:hypothetical protein